VGEREDPIRYGLVSDIHGNWEALSAVLAHLEEERVGSILCLGDVVGYGADPVACLDEITRVASSFVAGNHDHAAAGLLDYDWFNPFARVAAQWTARQLSRRALSTIQNLPLVQTIEDATLVHATPVDPAAWGYLIDREDGLAAFKSYSTRLCFIGHSHLPAVWGVGPEGHHFSRAMASINLDPGTRYLINVGSVGQPRDGDPRASCAVWDTDAGRVEIHRVLYDIETAQSKIRAAGLPRLLADRLAHGS
jgi:diadenosine tetraphosphatase ApaH/serine/threonine PP2A family protein phosphatase